MSDLADLLHFEESMTRTNISNALRIDITEQPPTAISQVTRYYAGLRDRLGFMRNDAVRMHEDALQLLLETETNEKIRTGLQSLLAELTEDFGLGWSEIARLIKVSVPAIRKWRLGGEVSPPRLYALAQLAAFLKILRDQDVADPAAWLATPLSPEVDRSTTKASIYADGHPIALLAFLDHHINIEELLQLVGISREAIVPRTEFVRGDDGSVTIVPLGS